MCKIGARQGQACTQSIEGYHLAQEDPLQEKLWKAQQKELPIVLKEHGELQREPFLLVDHDSQAHKHTSNALIAWDTYLSNDYGYMGTDNAS